METEKIWSGTLELDICSRSRKVKEAVWHPEGREPQSLSISHNLGMFVDTVLIRSQTEAGGIDVRFYNYPCTIEFYDCNVERVKIINHLPYTLSVRGFTEPAELEPYDSVNLKGTLIWW